MKKKSKKNKSYNMKFINYFNLHKNFARSVVFKNITWYNVYVNYYGRGIMSLKLDKVDIKNCKRVNIYLSWLCYLFICDNAL